jgi:hypothetical protein
MCMTDKRDLKRRVRERQARTGESYMTARRQVQEQRPGAIPMVELTDLTERGAALGFKCRIAVFPRVTQQLEAVTLLTRLRDALLATEGDHALSLMRRVVLAGERARVRLTGALTEEAMRFVRRARAGIGGVSDGGGLLAMPIEGVMLLFTLQLTPDFVPIYREPTLVIAPLDDVDDPMSALRELMQMRSRAGVP